MPRLKMNVGFVLTDPWPPAEVAPWSAQCPACAWFIREDQSWTRRLPRALEPQVEWRGSVPYSAITGERYHVSWRGMRMNPRRMVHWYCYENAAKILDADLRGEGWPSDLNANPHC